ncbi:MAG: hypothetical protein WC294_09185 [Methanoregula sp.]|jgi:hypothetical protein
MTIAEELEYIRKQHDGILFPKDVVEYARNQDTMLHSRFDWDDSIAAETYRIEQARRVIRVEVTILSRDETTIDTYVSLKQDQHNIDESGNKIGGYRSTVEVMSVPSLRKTLLEEALEEHEAWERKYQNIVELAEIFAAAKTVKEKKALQPVQTATV